MAGTQACDCDCSSSQSRREDLRWVEFDEGLSAPGARYCLSCSVAAPAYGAHPADDAYGYVPPAKFGASSTRTRNRRQRPLGMGRDWDGRRKRRRTMRTIAGQQDRSPTGGGQPRHRGRRAAQGSHSAAAMRAGSIVIDTAGATSTTCCRRSTPTSIRSRSGAGLLLDRHRKNRRRQAWPDWYPPKEMMRARPARCRSGCPAALSNPLGAIALYLGTRSIASTAPTTLRRSAARRRPAASA